MQIPFYLIHFFCVFLFWLYFLIMGRLCETSVTASLASFGIRTEKNDFHIFYCCCCRCCLFVCLLLLTGWVESTSWGLRMLEWEMRESYCLCLAFIWFHIPLTAYNSFSIACRFHCHNLFLHPSNSSNRHHVAPIIKSYMHA